MIYTVYIYIYVLIYIHNTYIDNHKSVQRGRGEVMHGYATSGYPSGMNGFVFSWEHSFFFSDLKCVVDGRHITTESTNK